MLLKTVSIPSIGCAEQRFRDAFIRLKTDKPEQLSKGTFVSQNNVAKEAGCVASALRKARFPSLIAEIQRWVEEHTPLAIVSPRQAMLSQRSRNRSLKERIEALKIERDHALSLLVEADGKILELMLENASLQAKLPESNLSSIHFLQK